MRNLEIILDSVLNEIRPLFRKMMGGKARAMAWACATTEKLSRSHVPGSRSDLVTNAARYLKIKSKRKWLCNSVI